ncbi:hypothetical protein [Bartonella grahamii]|uniref:hypothetical protein n=1 Tax=Bartonella grahamii TaxID=33045 RepID=UPI002E7AF4AD|nr:hypothetical protein [Bartonella grahamii]
MQRLKNEIDEKDKIIDKEAEIIRAQKDVIQKQEESIRRLTASKIIFPRMAVKNLAQKQFQVLFQKHFSRQAITTRSFTAHI